MASNPDVLLVLTLPIAGVECVLPGSHDPPSVGVNFHPYE